MALEKWLAAVRRSRATGTRWFISGWLVPLKIQGMNYITDEEGARFWERAKADEFNEVPAL